MVGQGQCSTPILHLHNARFALLWLSFQKFLQSWSVELLGLIVRRLLLQTTWQEQKNEFPL